MPPTRLQLQVGRTLRWQRELAGLTQAALATRTGVSQAAIARIERGDRATTLTMLERLFAALELQLALGVEPLDAHLDARIEELNAQSLADRLAATDLHDAMARLGDLPYALTGCTAALVQGAPVPVVATELVVRWRDVERFTNWLVKMWAQRWNAKRDEFGYLSHDPRDPGDHRWRTMVGEIRATMVDEFPETIEIRYDGRSYRVVPLPLVEVADPAAAALLRRWRDRWRSQDEAQ